MTKIFSPILLLILFSTAGAQLKVAITIDDVPNSTKFKRDHFHPLMLHAMDELKIPITIFINEGKLYKTEVPSRNFELLDQWIKRDYITVGNHTFSHCASSDVSLDSFAIEVTKGETITRELAKLYKKPFTHFRFPYNNLGADSLQQWKIDSLLHGKNYDVAPFTIESADYEYAKLYDHYQFIGDSIAAENTAKQYVEHTLVLFDYFDSLSKAQTGRSINQIYLCHDNSLNAEYLGEIVRRLRTKGYSFISFDEALKDKAYLQHNYYHKKWGISWLYRWIPDSEERKKALQREPEEKEIEAAYNAVMDAEKK